MQRRQSKANRRKGVVGFHPFRTLIILICLNHSHGSLRALLILHAAISAWRGRGRISNFLQSSRYRSLLTLLTSLSWRNNSTSHESDYPLTILVNRWNPVPR